MIMVNPALTNLQRELDQEKRDIQQKETGHKEAAAKHTALEAEMKTDEENIRIKKAEIVKLEQGIKLKQAEARKNDELRKKFEGELHALREKQEHTHLQLTKITREQTDLVRKAEADKRAHQQTIR